MTDLRALAAGVICVGFDGTTLDEALEQALRALPFAGLILFARNVETPEQTRALTDRLRGIYGNPVIAIDQEGGRVMRLRKSVEELPAMMALAAAGDEALAKQAGEQLGFDLRRAGVNLDFAPVLDLALFRMNTVIGARSFGDDPERVARFAGAFADGLRAQGVVPTFKHFPGHGSTDVDSHLDLPAIDLEEKTLREEIGFAGVCFTDCMQMDAIAKGMGSAAGAVRALIAGADCVLVSHSISIAQQSIEAIVKAVDDGTLPLARLQEAHARVTALRERLQPPLAIDAPAPHPGIGREIGRRAVTVMRGEAKADAAQSVVVTFEGVTVEGVQGMHSEHATLGGDLGLKQLRLTLDPQANDVDAALAHLRDAKKRPVILMRRAHIYAGQLEAVHRIVAAFPDALVVSTREPFDAFEVPEARHVLCTYSDDAPSLQGLQDVIFGGAQAAGRFPLGDAVVRA